MYFNHKTLLEIVEKAYVKLFDSDLNIIMDDVSERSLCGRLSVYIEDELKSLGLNDYHADLEYNRKQNGQVKNVINDEMQVIPVVCDLIVHSRGRLIKNDNLIAIEMKKSYRTSDEKDKDRDRLMSLTKKTYNEIWSNDGKTHPEHVCGYKIGIFMDLNISQRICFFESYFKGNLKDTWEHSF